MKPLATKKGRSVMGRQFYECGCGHRFRSTVVKGTDTVRCPACKQPCGVADVSPPKERGGVVYPRWLKDQDARRRSEVERAARLLLPGGENIRVVGLGSEGRASDPLEAPDQPAQPDQLAHIAPLVGDASGNLPTLSPARPATPLPGPDAATLRYEALMVPTAFLGHPGGVDGVQAEVAAIRSGLWRADEWSPARWAPPAPMPSAATPAVSELSADVPAQPPRVEINISELSPLEAEVIRAAREVVHARKCSQGRPSWPLAVTLRSLEDAVTALDAGA